MLVGLALRRICSGAAWPVGCSLLPASSPMVPASPRFENQPPGLAPHLLNIGSSWHWVVDALNGEDDVREGVDVLTWDYVLLEKRGERLVHLILIV